MQRKNMSKFEIETTFDKFMSRHDADQGMMVLSIKIFMTQIVDDLQGKSFNIHR